MDRTLRPAGSGAPGRAERSGLTARAASRSPSRATAADPAAPLVRALLEDSDAGAMLLNGAGRIEHLNAEAARMLGTSVARARGSRAGELLRSVVAGEDPVAEALRVVKAEQESVLVAPRGGELPVLWRSRRLPGGGVLLTLRDLSQRRRMQEELRRTERLATLGQLSAGVAHEIRNPLAGIGTSAQVLLRRFEPRDERARFVRVILDEVERLDRIVNSLLQYARPRTPQLAAGSLEALIRRVIELTADQVRQGGVRVEVAAANRVPTVYVDADLVTQVLLNVSLNAIQAMPEGGTLRYEVRLARRRTPPRGPGRRATDAMRGRPRERGDRWMRYLQVRISDTGTGIPRGTLTKLFDPFFTTRAQGTGLGLSISQTIMHEHGGTIEVASREGRGTTVLLGFPLEKRHGERRQLHAHPDDAHTARRR